jgi:hypothetical protein
MLATSSVRERAAHCFVVGKTWRDILSSAFFSRTYNFKISSYKVPFTLIFMTWKSSQRDFAP